MRVIFMGTPEFAVPALRALIASRYGVVAAFTQPDRPSGRGHKPQAPPVKALALAHNIPVYQPEKVRSEELQPIFDDLQADFIVVVAYGQILPGRLLRAARIAPVNIHGSLLPKYRGAAPVIWAILHGEPVTGITTMIMEERLDTGPILLQREFPIPETMTAGELAGQLAQIGAELLIPTLDGLREGTIRPLRQDDTQATSAPRIYKERAGVFWDCGAREIHNQIRAFHPWPLAFTIYQGAQVKLLRSRVAGGVHRGEQPGTYIGKTATGMLIQCGDDEALEIEEIQAANRHPVSGREFANGARLSPGMVLFPQRKPD